MKDGQIKYVIEHNVRNQKRAEIELEEYCKRKWSSRIHRMLYVNQGEPKFFYVRHKKGGGVVTAIQDVKYRWTGLVADKIFILLYKIGKPINI